jgi:hypothetical protein
MRRLRIVLTWALLIGFVAIQSCATPPRQVTIKAYDKGCSETNCEERALCIRSRLAFVGAEAEPAVAQLDRMIEARRSGRATEQQCRNDMDRLALQSFTVEGAQREFGGCGTACQVVLGGLAIVAIAAAASSGSGSSCCRVCTTGKACGDSCIAQSDQCHVGPGCACNG